MPNDSRRKETLYEAETIDELKKKLKAYELSKPEKHTEKQHNGQSKHQGKREPKPDKRDDDNRKCFNCGGKGHSKATCPDAGKGQKCFNCNSFGHISKDCRKPKVEGANGTTKPAPVMTIETTSEEKMPLPVTIRNHKQKALFDTGSPYTVMDQNLYKQLKLGRWSNYKVSMKGFAGRTEFSLGEIEVNMMINDENYSLRCQIIPNGLMSYRIILGRNILEQATVTIEDGIPVFSKTRARSPDNDIMMIQVDKPEKPNKRNKSIYSTTSTMHKARFA